MLYNCILFTGGEILIHRHKGSLIYKTMRVENQQKMDLDKRNFFTNAEIELAKSQKLPSTPYFVAADEKVTKENNDVEK